MIYYLISLWVDILALNLLEEVQKFAMFWNDLNALNYFVNVVNGKRATAFFLWLRPNQKTESIALGFV